MAIFLSPHMRVAQVGKTPAGSLKDAHWLPPVYGEQKRYCFGPQKDHPEMQDGLDALSSMKGLFYDGPRRRESGDCSGSGRRIDRLRWRSSRALTYKYRLIHVRANKAAIRVFDDELYR